jgi:hypothetical protein
MADPRIEAKRRPTLRGTAEGAVGPLPGLSEGPGASQKAPEAWKGLQGSAPYSAERSNHFKKLFSFKRESISILLATLLVSAGPARTAMMRFPLNWDTEPLPLSLLDLCKEITNVRRR